MKRAIISGGAGLIGSDICRSLSADGWEVASFDTADQSEERITNVHCDVSSEESVSNAFQQLGWDSLDLLVNNAGATHGIFNKLSEISLSSWNHIIDSHLTGAFLMSRAALPLLRKGGSIINVASTRAFMSESGDFAYAAAKGGLVSLTYSLAVHLGPAIRVNGIAPGWIADGSGLRDIDHNQHPAGRVGRPEDISHAVRYLAGAEFVTGQILTVDGGMTRKMIYSE